jgi:tetratricopeptide (TPR) repeat protein
MPYDLFISYSRRDNVEERITQLVDRIKQDFVLFTHRELDPFFDREEIHGMQDWRHRILQGLRESRLLLACLSPSYLESEYCQWEMVEYLKYEIGQLHGFNGVAPIYFVQVPGWGDKDFDQRCAAWVAELRRRQNFDLRPWHTQGEAALLDDAVRERMTKLNSRIAETIRRGEAAEKSLGNVDAHNPHFIGRTGILRTLRENFVKPGHIGVVTAVNGVGGLGKTALAVEYAHAFADEYGGGRWQVRCAGKDDLRLALAELATPMGFEFTDDEKKNPDLALERVRRELKKLADARDPHRCLLLLDNVDRPALLNPAMVARLAGGDWLHMLATTRLGENELSGSHKDRSFLPVDKLDTDEAVSLIGSYQREGAFSSDAEREAAREVVRLLDCFTLAVESAAVYLGQYAGDVSCAAFLARLRKEGLEGLEEASGQSMESVLHGEKSLSATLKPTLERLSDAEKMALEFAALLPPDQVALPWLRALVMMVIPEVGRDAEPGYPDPWKSLLRSLFSQRLLQATDAVDEDGQPRVVRVHRLVQQLVLRNCPDAERSAHKRAVNALITERDAALEATTEWVRARWELEPFTALANLWDEWNRPEAAWLLNQAGKRWHNLAEWGRCEPLARRALAIDERSYGADHSRVATDLNNLGKLLEDTNRMTEAEPLYRRALAIWEKSLGPDHPNLAIVLNNLAQLLQATNRLAEAEPLFRRALAINEKSYGPDHPHVAAALNNLAQLLQATNRLAEAEPMMRRALTIFERSFGPDHPNVAAPLNCLASLLQITNRQAEAEPLLRRALVIDEKSYGADHPRVAGDLNNLANLLYVINRLAEAEPLKWRVLAIAEKSYGPDHPRVATALNNLAQLLQATNRLEEAEPLLQRALAIDEKSYGSGHPDVARDLNNLAQLLQATNRLAEAERLYRRSLAIFEGSLGSDHPNVAVALNGLAQLLQTTDRLAEAEPLYRRALEIDEKSYGADHPRVAGDLNNLANLLYVINRLAEAEPLMRRALAIDEKSYGIDHPSVATDLNSIAQLLQTTNRLAEAEPMMRRALAIDEKSLGADHPRVATDLNSLAQLLQTTNRLAEAEPMMWRALAIDEKSFGADHPRVATDLNSLAQLLQTTNRLAEAEPLNRRALAIDEKSYGSNHPAVARDLNNLAGLLRAMNRLAEAEPLMRRALAIGEKSFGADHPDVGREINNLAQLLHATNRLSEAEPLYRRALAIIEASYGSDHPEVAIPLNDLAVLLEDMNQLAEAELLMRHALAIAEKSCGNDGPHVAVFLNTLATLFYATNRLAEAEPLMRRAVEILLKFTRATGHTHPNLKKLADNYRVMLRAMGNSEKQITAILGEMAPEFSFE